MSRHLQTPILDDGIRNPHYFNGRLLTADTLVAEQEANRQQREQLGRAVGAGIVNGLYAWALTPLDQKGAPSIPRLHIGHGLAINGKGQALALAHGVDLALADSPAQIGNNAGLFVDCSSGAGAAASATTGIFVLALSPASGYGPQRAPMRNIFDDSVEGCGASFAVEGVQFKAIELDASTMPGVSVLNDEPDLRSKPLQRSLMRNLLAHHCFGTLKLRDFAAMPFLRQAIDPEDPTLGSMSFFVRHGAIDDLRQAGLLDDCDVPLAIYYRAQGDIQLLDNWAVRRQPMRAPLDLLWPLHVGPRLPAELDAIFLQFQDQVQSLLDSLNSLKSVRAVEAFRFLPPVGYLPTAVQQFDPDTFFSNLPFVDSIEEDPAFVRRLVHERRLSEPIDLLEQPKTRIRLYHVNDDASYLIFAREPALTQSVPLPESPGSTTAPPDDPVVPAPSPGRILIDVVIDDVTVNPPILAVGAASIRNTDLVQSELPASVLEAAKNQLFELSHDLQVWAQSLNRTGGLYSADFVPTGLVRRHAHKIQFYNNRARFEIAELPADVYRVHVHLAGFQDASQTHAVKEGTTVRTVFYPVRVPDGRDFPAPPKEFDAQWLEPLEAYGKAIPLVDLAGWPPGPPIDEWPYRDPVVDPPPEEVLFGLRAVGAQMAEIYPDAPIDPGNIRIHVNPDHQPGAISEQPYAFAVFGEGGAYVPLILTSADATLPQPMSLRKGAVLGLDREMADHLAQVGVNSVDVLAAAWSGLLQSEIGFNAEVATATIESVGVQLETLQASVFAFPGVDADTAKALAALEISSAVDLANSDATALIGIFGSGSDLYANQLIGYAKGSVDPKYWSIEADSLGLGGDEVALLQENGVATQGQLAAAVAADAPFVRALRVSLGDEAVDDFANLVNVGNAGFAADFAALRNIRRVAGINEAEVSALTSAGFGAVGQLSSATDVDSVAAALGGDMARATELMRLAGNFLGGR